MSYGDTEETFFTSHTGWIHVRKALDLMRHAIHGKITVEEIARKVGVSKEYLGFPPDRIHHILVPVRLPYDLAHRIIPFMY